MGWNRNVTEYELEEERDVVHLVDVLRPLRASKSPMLTMPLSNRVYWGALEGVWELLREGAWASSLTGLVGEALELALESAATGGGSGSAAIGLEVVLSLEGRVGVDIEGAPGAGTEARTGAVGRTGIGGGMCLVLVIFPVLVSCFI